MCIFLCDRYWFQTIRKGTSEIETDVTWNRKQSYIRFRYIQCSMDLMDQMGFTVWGARAKDVKKCALAFNLARMISFISCIFCRPLLRSDIGQQNQVLSFGCFSRQVILNQITRIYRAIKIVQYISLLHERNTSIYINQFNTRNPTSLWYCVGIGTYSRRRNFVVRSFHCQPKPWNKIH